MLGYGISRPLMLLYGIRRLFIYCCRVIRRPLLLLGDEISGRLTLLKDKRRRVIVLHGDRGLMQSHGGVIRRPRLLLYNVLNKPLMLFHGIRRFIKVVDVIGRQFAVFDKT